MQNTHNQGCGVLLALTDFTPYFMNTTFLS